MDIFAGQVIFGRDNQNSSLVYVLTVLKKNGLPWFVQFVNSTRINEPANKQTNERMNQRGR